jgi:hypothetical protein
MLFYMDQDVKLGSEARCWKRSDLGHDQSNCCSSRDQHRSRSIRYRIDERIGCIMFAFMSGKAQLNWGKKG